MNKIHCGEVPRIWRVGNSAGDAVRLMKETWDSCSQFCFLWRTKKNLKSEYFSSLTIDICDILFAVQISKASLSVNHLLSQNNCNFDFGPPIGLVYFFFIDCFRPSLAWWALFLPQSSHRSIARENLEPMSSPTFSHFSFSASLHCTFIHLNACYCCRYHGNLSFHRY